MVNTQQIVTATGMGNFTVWSSEHMFEWAMCTTSLEWTAQDRDWQIILERRAVSQG